MPNDQCFGRAINEYGLIKLLINLFIYSQKLKISYH